MTIAKLLKRLEDKKLAARALMERHPEMTAKLGVAAAFEVSWEPLSDEAKVLAGLLGLFAAAPVKWAWVQDAWALAGNGLDEEDLEEAHAELLRVNLLQMAKEKEETAERRYQVHPLVREFFAVKLSNVTEAEALQRGFAQVMTEVAKTIPQAVTVTVRAQVTDAVPHMEEVAQRWTAGLEGLDKLWCCGGLGRFYENLSQWKEAERWQKRALEVSKSKLGEHHLDTASSLSNLAELYRLTGRYHEAEPLQVKALAIRKAKLGKRHVDTANSLNNLAILYQAQGRYDEAESLHVRALEIWIAQLGERHLNTANSLNNLAVLYKSQERYEEAELLCTKALAIRRSQLGECHPDTVFSLNNLASLYEFQGHQDKAESLYTRVIEIGKSELGDLHPYTAVGINNLARLYQLQKRYMEAEPLHTQVLEIRKVKLGERHPSTARLY